MEKHAQIKPDFQYLCFGALESYQLCMAAQAEPGLATLEMSLINKAWEWEWLLNKHSLLNGQKSFKYGIPGKRHNKECFNVRARRLPHRWWEVQMGPSYCDHWISAAFQTAKSNMAFLRVLDTVDATLTQKAHEGQSLLSSWRITEREERREVGEGEGHLWHPLHNHLPHA